MLFILQDTSVYKIPSFRTGPWDHTGREHSHCRHLQCTHGSAPHWPRRRKVSQVQNQLCAPQSDGPLLMCALSPGGLLTASPCFGSSLKPVKCSPSTYRGVWGGVWGPCCCCFPPYFALLTKFLSSILVWLGQWKGEGKQKEMAGLLSPFLRGGKPRRMGPCPAATLVSRRFLSSLSTELCGGRAAAGGWDWIPQERRKAGKRLLTS